MPNSIENPLERSVYNLHNVANNSPCVVYAQCGNNKELKDILLAHDIVILHQVTSRAMYNALKYKQYTIPTSTDTNYYFYGIKNETQPDKIECAIGIKKDAFITVDHYKLVNTPHEHTIVLYIKIKESPYLIVFTHGGNEEALLESLKKITTMEVTMERFVPIIINVSCTVPITKDSAFKDLILDGAVANFDSGKELMVYTSAMDCKLVNREAMSAGATITTHTGMTSILNGHTKDDPDRLLLESIEGARKIT